MPRGQKLQWVVILSENGSFLRKGLSKQVLHFMGKDEVRKGDERREGVTVKHLLYARCTERSLHFSSLLAGGWQCLYYYTDGKK